MNLILTCCIIPVITLAIHSSALAKHTPFHPPSAAQTKDSSLLRPADTAYADAIDFSRFLERHGFRVQSLHRSKFEGFFRGVNKAAFIRTDRGIIEVIFFDEAGGAGRINVTERREDGRYIYTFEGQPEPMPNDAIDSNRPVYFMKYKNQLMITDDRELAAGLKLAVERG